ncbi:MAG: hypothetical protein J6U54_01230 [Clostridiales bacterium]|nr:hypothetical protein [Clostridiales bacterium]
MKLKKVIEAFVMARKNNMDGYSDYPGVGIIKDIDVAKFTIKHMHWYDLPNIPLVICNGLASQLILMKVIEEPKDKNWKFPI